MLGGEWCFLYESKGDIIKFFLFVCLLHFLHLFVCVFVCFQDDDDDVRVVFSLRERGRRHHIGLCLFVCCLVYLFVCFEDGDESDVGRRVVFSLRERGRRHKVFIGLFVCCVCLFVCLFRRRETLSSL